MIGAVMASLAFFTQPDGVTLAWSVVLLVASFVSLSAAGILTRPPRLVAGSPTPELGSESPAVASLLTNGFTVGPPAAVATLLDLVARGWLRIEHAGHEVIVLTDQRGREGDVLSGYEQQVLNHVHRLTTGSLTGVSGAGIEVAGLRLPRRWLGRFRRGVVADARRQGLVHRRWGVAALGLPVLTVVLAGWSWWRAVRGGDDVAVADSLTSRAIAGAVGVAVVVQLVRIVRRLCSTAQRVTALGLERATHWMSLRAWMEPRGFEGASSGTANNTTRALAYAAAMGLAERAAEELPVVPEDDRLAWSNATGSWHVVRVGYPFRPGYGRHPALVLLVGGVGAVVAFVAHRFLLGVARGHRWAGLLDDFPDQVEWLERIALGLAIVVLLPLAWLVWLMIAGAFDLFATVKRQGVVVRARRPARVAPLARVMRSLTHRDRYALFVAVDDGRSDRVQAWMANERTAIPQGARARVHATPLLGYVRTSEPIGATRTTVDWGGAR
ncbi:MAG: DUF2207 family protein [Desertimonas sp.]